MAYQGVMQPGDALLEAGKCPSNEQIPTTLDLSADGFDIWWKRTAERHAAVVSQASALMRAHQRLRYPADIRVGQSH
jgi:hypothetical protein